MFWLTRSTGGAAAGLLLDLVGAGLKLLRHLPELPGERRPVGRGDLAQTPGAFPKKLDLVA
jgi:hypothetical protein